MTDVAGRIVAGLAVPYQTAARDGVGRWQYAPGCLSWPGPVWLLVDHDRPRRYGRAVWLLDTPDGLWCRMRVRPGPDGDRLLSRVASGELAGFSVGVDVHAFDRNPGVFVVRAGVLRDVSLTRTPLFAQARVMPAERLPDHEE